MDRQDLLRRVLDYPTARLRTAWPCTYLSLALAGVNGAVCTALLLSRQLTEIPCALSLLASLLGFYCMIRGFMQDDSKPKLSLLGLLANLSCVLFAGFWLQGFVLVGGFM